MSSSIDELNREKTSIARLSIVSNLSLVILKLIVGFMIGSVSVISEAIHSGIDLIAAVIAYFSVRNSSKPPDREHAFGHGKLENISGTTESIALEADAWHLRTDVLTSLGIFAGLVAIKLTGITILDPIFAILVALFILKAAAELIIKSVKDLMDVKLPEEEEKEICQIIEDHSKQYAGFHKLRTRKSGSDRFIDLHLVVSKELTIEQAHCLTDHIEKDIKGRFPRASVIIHTEPCKDGDECARCTVKDCSKYQFREEE